MKKTVTVGVYTIIMSKIHRLSQVAAFIFLLVALSSFLLVYAPLRSINGDKQNLIFWLDYGPIIYRIGIFSLCLAVFSQLISLLSKKGSMIFSVVTQMGDNTEYLFLSSK